jgi:hypothetical protein
MGLGSPVVDRRRGSARAVVGAVAALVIIVIGVIVIVNVSSSGSKGQVAKLEAILDRAPLPVGAQLVGQKDNDAHGDLAAYAERQYRLAAAADSSAQIRTALAAARYRLVDGQSGEITDVTAPAWSTFAGPDSGDVNVLPPGASGGGVEFNWKGDALYVSVQQGDID